MYMLSFKGPCNKVYVMHYGQSQENYYAERLGNNAVSQMVTRKITLLHTKGGAREQ